MTRYGSIPLRPLRIGAALIALATVPFADKIHQTDGKVIDEITIVHEGISQITYKKGRNERTVASEKVLSVEFEKFPENVDEAEGAVAAGDLLDALDLLDAYVDEQIEKPSERRYKWAPPFAAWRAVELRVAVADMQGVASSATRLIQNFPDSRYVTDAYLAKASAQFQGGDAPQAARTLADMEALVRSKSLSKRWELACNLAKVQVDPAMKGDEKRNRLALIASEAGKTYPLVKSRAEVTGGETYLLEAEGTRDPAKAASLRAEAQKVFERIVAEFKADDATLAGAYTGLGDCLFYAAKGDRAMVEKARKQYLRVIVNYDAQSSYVPKALYYAMLCSDQLGDKKRKFDMKRELKSLYPNSLWASEADKH